MKIPTIQAVRCNICGRLHGINDHDYFILWGKLVVNTNATEPMDLGTEIEPTILCQNTVCLQRLFRLIDDTTYRAMLERPKQHHDDTDYE